MKFWMIEDSYPGLAARYPIAVLPGKDINQVQKLAGQLGLLNKSMPVHVRPATPDEVASFVSKSIDEVSRAKALEALLPYFDAYLRSYFPDAP